ncbi:MAG: DUF4870 domain-containing protein [Planctomycetota bacterium]
MSEASSEMPGASPSNEERTWGMVSHLVGLVGFLGPLIVWLIQKDKMPFVDDQGKESLNFQITVLIATFAAGLTTCIGIGFVLVPLVVIADIVFCILGAVAANRGEAYRYPVTLRLIK